MMFTLSGCGANSTPLDNVEYYMHSIHSMHACMHSCIHAFMHVYLTINKELDMLENTFDL